MDEHVQGAAALGDAEELSASYLATLEELSGLLFEEAPLDDLPQQVLDLTARAIPTATAVSVTVIGDDGGLGTAASSSAEASAVDALQRELQEGPCVEAARTGEVRDTADLCADDRWPAVRERATQLGLRAVLAVPLRVNDVTFGVLNLYAAGPGGLSGLDHELARRLAAPAAATLANARAYRRVSTLADQLGQALRSRVVIEQAKGVLMAREGCDADTAFELLRRASQDSNRRLRDVAELLVQQAGSSPAS